MQLQLKWSTFNQARIALSRNPTPFLFSLCRELANKKWDWIYQNKPCLFFLLKSFLDQIVMEQYFFWLFFFLILFNWILFYKFFFLGRLFFRAASFWTNNLFRPAFFWTNTFCTKIFLDQRYFLGLFQNQNYFEKKFPLNFFLPIFFLFDWNSFRTENVFGPKTFWTNNSFNKMFFGPNFFD